MVSIVIGIKYIEERTFFSSQRGHHSVRTVRLGSRIYNLDGLNESFVVFVSELILQRVQIFIVISRILKLTSRLIEFSCNRIYLIPGALGSSDRLKVTRGLSLRRNSRLFTRHFPYLQGRLRCHIKCRSLTLTGMICVDFG